VATQSVIRACAEHLEEAVRLIEEYQDAVGVVVRDDRDTIAATLQAEDKAIWLAYVDSEAAGCIAYRDLKHPAGAGEVKRLYVRPMFRGQGLAARLLEAVENFAVQKSTSVLYLDSKDDLMAAIHFYRAAGYQPCERYNDNPQATIFMKKELEPSKFEQGEAHSPLVLRPFQAGDAEAFRVLNESWITGLFKLEAKDIEVLRYPERKILAAGGHIFMAERDGAPVGCCALIAMDAGEFEVAKMAVAEAERGRGIGRKLLDYTIQQAETLGARRLYLETSSRLGNAIHLYEEAGFRHLAADEVTPSGYERADVYMERLLAG
jgi:putative acetyltransferase